MEQENLLTIAELAQLLRVSPRSVRRRLREGTIPNFRVGRLVRIPTRHALRALGLPGAAVKHVLNPRRTTPEEQKW